MMLATRNGKKYRAMLNTFLSFRPHLVSYRPHRLDTNEAETRCHHVLPKSDGEKHMDLPCPKFESPLSIQRTNKHVGW